MERRKLSEMSPTELTAFVGMRVPGFRRQRRARTAMAAMLGDWLSDDPSFEDEHLEGVFGTNEAT